MRPEGVPAEMAVGTDSYPGVPPIRLGKTAPGSVAVAAAPGGGTPVPLPPTTVSPDEPLAPLTLRMSAPERARSDSELVVDVAVSPSEVMRGGRLNLFYDPKLLQALSPVGGTPGVLELTFAPNALARPVRFRVLAAATGVTSIALRDGAFADSDGNPLSVILPPPVNVSLGN